MKGKSLQNNEFLQSEFQEKFMIYVRLIVSSTVLLVLYLLPCVTHAFDFEVREVEFQTWDERCKALYASTGSGEKYGYASRVPRDIIKKWANLEIEIGGGPWHYCAGVALIMRANSESDKVERKQALSRAIRELEYSRRNAPTGSRTHIESTIQIAVAYRQIGEQDKAIDLVKNLIQVDNQQPSIYTMLYLLHRDLKQQQKSLDALLLGEKLLENESSEVFYFIGLEYFNKKDYEKSAAYAKKAYDLGYPLPGLRDKLRRVNVILK